MKIELRSIKSHSSLSEETNAFSATLYVNDVKSGFVSNDGRGGNNRIELTNNSLLKPMMEWARAQPAVKFSVCELPMNLDFYLSILVDNELVMCQAKRYFSNHVCYDHGDGELRVSKRLIKDMLAKVHAGEIKVDLKGGQKMYKTVDEVYAILQTQRKQID
jgi:hypothetical protein